METIQIQVPSDLLQRLRPYQNDLASLLELGLRYLEKQTKSQPAFDLEQYKQTEQYQRQKRLQTILREQAGVIGPDVDTRLQYTMQPDNQNWQPIEAAGKPASQIIIQQRQGILEDE